MYVKFSQESVTVLQKKMNYEESRVKVTNTQLHRLKSAAKNKTGSMLRIKRKTFKMKDWFMNYFCQWGKTETGNVFANNLLTDVKLSKVQLSKMIH